MTGQELLNERKENFLNQVNRRPAKWVPILSINSIGSFGYAGKSYWDLEHDFEGMPKAMGKIYDVLSADASTGDTPSFNARADEYLRGCTQYKLTTDGYNLQHLQNSVMRDDEYAQACKDPHAFIKEVILPRRYPFLFEIDPKEAADIMVQVIDERDFCGAKGPIGGVKKYIEDTYGIYHLTDKVHRVSTPGDVLFDLFRGFKGTLTDLRRHYSEVQEFCDVLWEKNFCMHYDGTGLWEDQFPAYMAHIPTFLSVKQYGDICFKYYKQQVEGMAKGGTKNFLLAEGGWSHLYDYFLDLPKDSVLMSLENDDVIESYKKLGHHQIIMGGSKMCDLKLNTKEACIDKAKEVIDACAPTGAYVFTTDKAWCCNGDITQNLIDVYNFVREYGKY